MTRGFLTLAAGDDHYRRLAANLLRSYRAKSEHPLPFAIMTDRETPEIRNFDRIILLENAEGSYLDKLRLFENLPFDETIFIDADCLAYGNLNGMFDWFAEGDDLSCHGRILPLTDKTGWFVHENLGPLREKVPYCLGLHGGIYYIRRTEQARQVFETAKELVKGYDRYGFRGNFPTPGDEPVMALSMALHGMKPIPFRPEGICCYWEHEKELSFRHGACRLGENNPLLIHWGTRFTRRLRYRWEVWKLGGKGHG